MLLLSILLITTTLALSSGSDDDGRVVDLQELLLNVSNSYRDFGQGIKELGQNEERYVLLINKNIQQVIENTKHVDENLKENTEVLKQILKVLVGKEEGTTQRTLVTEPQEQVQGKDCAELYTRGERSSGIYNITVPDLGSFKVFCDMTTDGGGWTVFQRRGDFGLPRDYFSRNWIEFKNGFGELTKEFWLGLDRISALSHQGSYQLRVDLWDLEGNKAYSQYSDFRVENETAQYTLRAGAYSGNAGDSLDLNRNKVFQTKDKNNGHYCTDLFRGAWWHTCSWSNLNGLNLRGYDNTATGIWWEHWKGWSYSLAFTEMKTRPTNF